MFIIDHLKWIVWMNLLTMAKFKRFIKSGGIFPDFTESLIIMPDYSLGFIKNTPTDGFKIYNQ